MATWRVKYGGTAGDNWQVQKSGRFVKEKDIGKPDKALSVE